MLDGKVEIITGRDRRRRWSDADKLRIVAEAEAPGACFAHVAQRNEISRGLLWNWRSQVRRGALRAEPAEAFLAVRLSSEPMSIGRTEPNPATPSRAGADQIEVDLADGSRLRVGAEVSLAALRRVIAALRG